MIIELKALYSFQVSVDDVAGMEVLKALRNFVELEYRVHVRYNGASQIRDAISPVYPNFDGHAPRDS